MPLIIVPQAGGSSLHRVTGSHGRWDGGRVRGPVGHTLQVERIWAMTVGGLRSRIMKTLDANQSPSCMCHCSFRRCRCSWKSAMAHFSVQAGITFALIKWFRRCSLSAIEMWSQNKRKEHRCRQSSEAVLTQKCFELNADIIMLRGGFLLFLSSLSRTY